MWTVTEWNEGGNFTWVSRNPGVLVTAEHSIYPVSNGSVVVLIVSFEGFLSALVGGIAAKLTNQYIALEAAGLKRRCEEMLGK